MNKIIEGENTVRAEDQNQWRSWLKNHHATNESIWLILFHKESGIPSVTYTQAVQKALCFGWIDSRPNKRDDKSYYCYFARRNPKSNWSKINKVLVEKLISEGKREKAGLSMVKIAKENGTWNALDGVENLIEPEDLKHEFKKNDSAYDNWANFPKSVKRGILEWILNAKKTETRTKRISETVQLASKNERANQSRKT